MLPLLLAACSDMEVLLEMQPGGCWQPASPFASLAVYVGGGSPQNLAGLTARCRECLDVTPPKPAIAEAVSTTLNDRGYVAKGVDASKTTWIVIHLLAAPGCPPDTPLVCLLSEPIPPDGKKSSVKLGAVCPIQPPTPPNPEFQRCISVGM